MAVADAILHSSSIFEPDVREPHARMGAWHVVYKTVLRPFVRFLAALRGDQWRAHIAIAELGAQHLVGFALLDVGDACKVGAGLGPFRRVVANVGAPHGAP